MRGATTGSRPGVRSFARRDRSDFNFFAFANSSNHKVLQRLVELTQYASQDSRDVLSDEGIVASMRRQFVTRLWDTNSRGKISQDSD